MKRDPHQLFLDERRTDQQLMIRDPEVAAAGARFVELTLKYKYSLNFSWLGRPIVQLPQDIIAIQELEWRVKPDLIIETGIAHGGSLILHASVLELIGGDGRVLGIDVDIRRQNRKAIEKHPLAKRIEMIEGSSTDEDVIRQVRDLSRNSRRVMVILDSNHTHEHVSKELELYSPLVSKGSYLVVLDTIIEDLPDDSYPDRAWGKGNNPKTAVWNFLKKNSRFAIDQDFEQKLGITCAPDGFLKCLAD
jgi:cephalosporin hydroxylase